MLLVPFSRAFPFCGDSWTVNDNFIRTVNGGSEGCLVVGPSSAGCEGFLRLTPTEWKILRAYPSSQNLAKVASSTGLPYSTVVDVTRRLRERGVTVHYVPKLDRLGVVPLLVVMEGDMPPQTPAYTVYRCEGIGKRKYTVLHALLPDRLVHDYLSLLPKEPAIEIRGLDVRYWDPRGRLTRYDAGRGVVVLDESDFEKVLLSCWEFRTPEERRWVDWLDLLILSYKMRNAYAKLSSVMKKSSGFVEYAPSRQLLSYHYRMHVVPLWRVNAIRYELQGPCPRKLYILEGKPSAAAACSLVEAPYFHEAVVGESAACVLSQHPCALEAFAYKVVYIASTVFSSEVDMEEIILTEFARYEWLTPELLSRYREHGTWPPPSELPTPQP
uniref:Lrp/AsnC family transcriptional regulator n=1 Tax=Thermofilum pendens TaxID=2269 RepID=A0A7C3SLC0_THEPE